MNNDVKIYYHLPGLFEFYDLYRLFLPLFRNHREYFYDNCEIGSIYGAPDDALWGGGRIGFGDENPRKVAQLMSEYGISARLTFSNSLIKEEHLSDRQCNDICALFEKNGNSSNSNSEKVNGINENGCIENGVIVSSDILLEYIRKNYPGFYFVSSTTKVITDFEKFQMELDRDEFRYVVPDFRLNKEFDKLNNLTDVQKAKVEFLCNECCWFECYDRKNCYINVSQRSLGMDCKEHKCVSPDAMDCYKFSKAMKNPGFIGLDDIRDHYIPAGFRNFKIEGRSLGSAVILEFLLYYMTKTEYQLNVREEIYLESSLDLF